MFMRRYSSTLALGRTYTTVFLRAASWTARNESESRVRWAVQRRRKKARSGPGEASIARPHATGFIERNESIAKRRKGKRALASPRPAPALRRGDVVRIVAPASSI